MRKLNDLSIIEKEKLFNKLRILTTHHSNAIEGTTLTLGETEHLLKYNLTAHDKPLSEQLIILGFARAYDLVIREASNTELNSSIIKDIHAILFSEAYKIMPSFIEKPIGTYRNDERKIKGAEVKLTKPNLISVELENLLFKYNKKMNLEDISDFHIKFERIHPFADGNGRVGRLIMYFQCIKNGIIPPLVKLEERKLYLNSLEDKKTLNNFLEKCIIISIKLINEQNSHKNY